ncbi:cysteine proteinase inhibitor-like [Actinidia eriantha]|uniref:cysteine proteinase inhibitor-like n=1 Tax=Actinidia eriantha TaxID=165200 RepID=UPI00258838E2|nr:cysteine proteinase inhibitor-like [Actinidia eriantha]XP_057480860.1 cysteine proteinase inhibitor-like [Actinidia eriantha]XP_057480861.1 cysteine proteinase inhibitor-like [Actinidia eriantha]XP_057480862.1 cysteine proteinase inhibitor-like [Actinidia eriantha]
MEKENERDARREVVLGGIRDMEGGENSLEIDSLARFAVDEHNKKENALLEFKRVVKVKHQVVAGTAYYISLEATSGGQTKVYEAKVWEKPWMDFKQLVEFKLVSDA